MLLDVRTYTCRPGTIKKHLELYAKMGAEPQSRNLGKPLLYMTTETGNPNQYVHIWAYENAGDREAKRKNLWADPDWLAYVQESGKLGALEAQENHVMVPVDFSQIPLSQLQTGKGCKTAAAKYNGAPCKFLLSAEEWFLPLFLMSDASFLASCWVR